MDLAGPGRGRADDHRDASPERAGIRAAGRGKDERALTSVGVRRLREVLESDQFVTTVEYNPPKGTDITPIMDNAKALLGKVHGVNVTDNTAAILRAGSLSLCRMLYEMGHDPVMQVTCRDRNRLAIQSDLLSAHILGIRNILCLTGDYPTVGDHKDAKPVYDLDSIGIMQVIHLLNQGKDLAGHKLQGATALYIGAAITPEQDRSEERRVGKECRSRWSPYH